MGYNPYRKANGEFATKEEAGAQVENDYSAAVASGDAERIAEIEVFVVQKMDTTPLGQKVLQKRFGELAGCRKDKKPKSRRVEESEEEKRIRVYREKRLQSMPEDERNLYIEEYERLKTLTASEVLDEINSQIQGEIHGDKYNLYYETVAINEVDVAIPDSMKFYAANFHFKRNGFVDPRFSVDDAKKILEDLDKNPNSDGENFIAFLRNPEHPYSKVFGENSPNDEKVTRIMDKCRMKSIDSFRHYNVDEMSKTIEILQKKKAAEKAIKAYEEDKNFFRRSSNKKKIKRLETMLKNGSYNKLELDSNNNILEEGK